MRTADGQIDDSLYGASLSADGHVAAFPSTAGNLATGVDDRNGLTDIYLSQTTGAPAAQLVTRAVPPREGLPPGGSEAGSLSADGRWLTYARNGYDLVLRDRQTGREWLVCRYHLNPIYRANQPCYPQAISPDGRWVWFRSGATNLVPNFVNSCALSCDFNSYLFDRDTQTVILLFHRPDLPGWPLDDGGVLLGVSTDGRWTLFESPPDELLPGTSNPFPDYQVFLYDRTTRSARLVSGVGGAPDVLPNGYSSSLGMSPDGRWILFRSLATNLVAGVSDANNGADVFLHDRETGTTRLISHASGQALQTANGVSDNGTVSEDGTRVFLHSTATNLVDGIDDNNQATDVFGYVIADASAFLVTRSASTANQTANGGSKLQDPYTFWSRALFVRNLSADGRHLLLTTQATDLQSGVTDQNAAADLYLVDTVNSAIRLVTHQPGSPLQTAPTNTYLAQLSASGRRVLFNAQGTGLAAGAAPSAFRQVYQFVNDEAGGNSLLSAPRAPAMGSNGDAFLAGMDAEGTLVLFNSQANNLLPGVVDQNNKDDGFFARDDSPLFADGFEG